jgi:RNA polymerase sigma-70 factor (ECF subfamily)
VVGRQGFDDFYAVHFPVLTVQLAAYLGDVTEAQDVVQEAFLRAWSRWERLETYDEPVTWVRRVAWNIATSRWRRMRTAASFLHRQRVGVVEGPSPDRVALDRALAALPDNQRRSVVLHHVAGLSVPEIAAEWGMPEGTIKSWLHRGRTTLHAALAQDTETGSEARR